MRFLPLLLLAACASLTPAQRAERLYQEARQAFARGGEPSHALVLIDEAIALNPERADYLSTRAVLHRILRQPERALADYRLMVETLRRQEGSAAEISTALANIGVLHGEAGRLDAAEEAFSEALGLAPQHTEIFLQRARFRRRAGREEAAARDVEAARKVGAGLADTFYNEGVRAVERGDLDEAERLFGFALQLVPVHAHAHVGMSRICLERRRFADAAAHLTRALRAHPEEADLYYHRATARLGESLWEEALADLQDAIRLDPAQAPYYSSRGFVLRRRGDADGAMKDFDRAVELDPEFQGAWIQRGLLFQERREFGPAERDLRTALTIHATAEATLALARVFLDQGAPDKAITLLQQSLAVLPDEDDRRAVREEIEKAEKAKSK